MMGLYFEEIEDGRQWALGHYDFTRDNVLAFARAYDPQSFHVDDAAAAASHFGRLAASGWHTAAAWMRCFVDTCDHARRERLARGGPLPALGPSPGFTQLRWIKPVYPGDRIAYSTAITGRRDIASRPRWGLIAQHNEGINQKGELVFSFEGKVMVERLPERS
jgi:acyl dehydratase